MERMCHVLHCVRYQSQPVQWVYRWLHFNQLMCFKTNLIPHFATAEHREISDMIDRVAEELDQFFFDLRDMFHFAQDATEEHMNQLDDRTIMMAHAIDRLAFLVTGQHPIVHNCADHDAILHN
ncbi:unnamed protein product [Caenorhabditis bovis]|uniref:Uncharacterized protein n=1 Tax=Caenorhabditis bovis TaxID=2654633 RepID=A0A8S1EJH5_9PELO|nr:unnamed protein product [Caenorhabditis bovis]